MRDKIKLTILTIISLAIIITGALFSYQSFKNREVTRGILGASIAVIIMTFAIIAFKRSNRDLKRRFPLKDERSKKVMEKASSLSFYISLYVLLLIGFLSDLIPFRNISQATAVAVGCMALLFLITWLYYNKKEI